MMLRAFKRHEEMDATIMQLLQRTGTNIPVEILKTIASYYAEAQNLDKATDMMRFYLTKKTDDAISWYELGLMYAHQSGKKKDAFKAIRKALQLDGTKIRELMRTDGQRLAVIAGDPEFQQMMANGRLLTAPRLR